MLISASAALSKYNTIADAQPNTWARRIQSSRYQPYTESESVTSLQLDALNDSLSFKAKMAFMELVFLCVLSCGLHPSTGGEFEFFVTPLLEHAKFCHTLNPNFFRMIDSCLNPGYSNCVHTHSICAREKSLPRRGSSIDTDDSSSN